jgi:anti-sigma-K factor RskA
VLAAATGARPPRPAVLTRLFWSAAAIVLISLTLSALLRPDGPPRQMRFVSTPAAPEARGHAAWKGSSVEIVLSGLPSLPPGKVYQLWHLGVGPSPAPHRTFRLDAAGELRGRDEMREAIGRGQGFAITQEPQGGSLRPTLPIYTVTAP